jgi:phosphoribosylanthranilate isomerase
MSVEVKICGLKDAANLEAALAAGADFIGLVFYRPSPRYIGPAAASALADLARGRAKIVALVVDPADALAAEIAAKVKPDYIQAHGSESPQRIGEITRLTGVPVIKAIKVRAPEDVEGARAYRDVAEMILFDARAPETLEGALPGGNGIAFDWTLLARDARPRRFMLSGGLDAGNVARAIFVTGAAIVDVSSGVEDRPGVKNPVLIRKFIEMAKAAG